MLPLLSFSMVTLLWSHVFITYVRGNVCKERTGISFLMDSSKLVTFSVHHAQLDFMESLTIGNYYQNNKLTVSCQEFRSTSTCRYESLNTRMFLNVSNNGNGKFLRATYQELTYRVNDTRGEYNQACANRLLLDLHSRNTEKGKTYAINIVYSDSIKKTLDTSIIGNYGNDTKLFLFFVNSSINLQTIFTVKLSQQRGSGGYIIDSHDKEFLIKRLLEHLCPEDFPSLPPNTAIPMTSAISNTNGKTTWPPNTAVPMTTAILTTNGKTIWPPNTAIPKTSAILTTNGKTTWPPITAIPMTSAILTTNVKTTWPPNTAIPMTSAILTTNGKTIWPPNTAIPMTSSILTTNGKTIWPPNTAIPKTSAILTTNVKTTWPPITAIPMTSAILTTNGKTIWSSEVSTTEKMPTTETRPSKSTTTRSGSPSPKATIKTSTRTTTELTPGRTTKSKDKNETGCSEAIGITFLLDNTMLMTSNIYTLQTSIAMELRQRFIGNNSVLLDYKNNIMCSDAGNRLRDDPVGVGNSYQMKCANALLRTHEATFRAGHISNNRIFFSISIALSDSVKEWIPDVVKQKYEEPNSKYLVIFVNATDGTQSVFSIELFKNATQYYLKETEFDFVVNELIYHICQAKSTKKPTSQSPSSRTEEITTTKFKVKGELKKEIKRFTSQNITKEQLKNSTWVENFLAISSQLLNKTQNEETEVEVHEEGEGMVEFIEETLMKIGSNLEVGMSITITTESLVAEVIAVKTKTFKGHTFPQQSNASLETSSLNLPSTLLRKSSSNKTSIVGMKYKPLKSMKKMAKHLAFADDVISISVDPPIRTLFDEPLNFTMSKLQNNFTGHECVYWNTSLIKWDSFGCNLSHVDDNQITCQCFHMTSFSILMQVRDFKISDDDAFALMIISYVGCSVSIASCACMILIYICLRRILKIARNIIHVNLAIAITISNALFISADSAVDKNDICLGISITMLYFYLATFFWMLVEGIHVYLMIFKVFKTTKRMTYYLVIGWVFPGIITAVTSLIHHDLMTTDNFCWISTEKGVIWAFVGPAIFILVTNTVILIMTLKASRKIKIGDEEVSELRRIARLTLVLLPIFGISWIFGVLAINRQTVVFQYVFTTLNVFQGLFIFIGYGIMNNEVRREASRRTRMSHSGELSQSGSTLKTNYVSTMTPKRFSSMDNPTYCTSTSGGGNQSIPENDVTNNMLAAETSYSIQDSYRSSTFLTAKET